MGRRWYASRGPVAALIGILLLAPGPWLAGDASPFRSSPTFSVLPVGSTGGSIQGAVTWDGTNVSSARTDSSALTVDLASTITLRYHWSSASAYNLSDARLQMFYFGFALSTRDVIDQNPHSGTNGTFTMTWQAGAISYLLEGSYRLTASLLDSAGNTRWSQDFYIHAKAPFSILAAIPILLVLIAIYEIYGLLTAGRTPAPPSSRHPPSTSPSRGAPPKASAPPESDEPEEVT